MNNWLILGYLLCELGTQIYVLASSKIYVEQVNIRVSERDRYTVSDVNSSHVYAKGKWDDYIIKVLEIVSL